MSEIITKQIRKINFKLFSPQEIKKIGVAKIVTPELYDMDGYPVDGGLMDLRLGAIDPGVRCRTCGGKLKECPGHFGYIELARPVIHVKYSKMIEILLRCTCHECGNILISQQNLKKLKNRKAIIKKARDVKSCPFCKAKQEKIKLEKPTTFRIGKKRLFPNEIREWLTKIPDSVLKIFGLNPKTARPEWAVLTLLLVPPVTIRPSITLETGERSEDDLTHKLSDIVRANQRLWENLNAGAPEVIIEDLWDLLQYHITTFFDNTISSIPPARHRSGQLLKTITERIKGKEGHIRHNLAGKRVNFSSRSVISPDPTLELNEVGVPLEIAKVLTVPEKVNNQNIEYLKRLIKKGSEYPGANYIIRPDGKKKKITEELKEELIEELDKGYYVERHLRDGDIVLFNRHPSLHKLSLMAHYTKVLPYRTFRLHPSVAFPYNADYDGDEMNVHVPQTEEARSEAKVLMDVAKQLISPKNNTTVFGCIMDAITGNYLLTKEARLSKEKAVQLLYESGVSEEEIKKARLGKEVDGKTIFSVLLPKINFEAKTKSGEKIIKIKEGKLIRGEITRKVVGVEGTDNLSLIKFLDREIGINNTINILKKIFSLGLNYCFNRGFTISIEDIRISDSVYNSYREIMGSSNKKVQTYIDDYYNKTLEIIPGKTEEETREIKILQTLNEIRGKIGAIIKKSLSEKNPLNIMVLSGSGGNILYITQMGCSVGQQSLWAKRIDFGYSNRTLSFYKKQDISPRARGFIDSSYFKGLEPDEFFFSAMTGRDGLMDTALRTPKSGYLYRRLSNALQDLRVEYDWTVRNANGRIIQFEYGGDKIEVSKKHLKENKITPGEAIGIITAQSFGEPATQMTLNVFHFAGVSEMQVTLGLPRLIEIFDARKQPSTPAMTIYLKQEYNNEKFAKKFAKRIKEVQLIDIVEEIKVDFTSKKMNILFDRRKISELKLNISEIKDKIKVRNIKLRLKQDGISIDCSNLNLREIYKLRNKIKNITISGVKGIKQILLVKKEGKYIILTAGSNLKEILELKGVDKEKTTTNNLHEIYEVLGIEATRQAIINEVENVISKQGFDIDRRHIELIADAMTSSGEFKGVTRVGIISDKNSVLARATFETPIRHFVNASIGGKEDKLVSVIENIIFNQPVPIGTGLPGLLLKIREKLIAKKMEEIRTRDK